MKLWEDVVKTLLFLGARMIPWVEQFGDCGQSGSKVHVPLTFFQNLKGNLKRKCKLIFLIETNFGVKNSNIFLDFQLPFLSKVSANINLECLKRRVSSTIICILWRLSTATKRCQIKDVVKGGTIRPMQHYSVPLAPSMTDMHPPNRGYYVKELQPWKSF